MPFAHPLLDGSLARFEAAILEKMMEGVTGALLILLLAGDPGSVELAQHLAPLLRADAQRSVELVVSPQADARLADYGVGVADILADRHLGQHLSRSEPVVVVHLQRETTGGDQVLTARLWFAGRYEQFVAIAGAEQSAEPDLVLGVGRLLRPLLDPAYEPIDYSTLPIADLVQREAWQPLLGRLVGKTERSPKDWYYLVLAYVRLHQRDAAVAALNEFRAAVEQHFLIAAAETLIPPPEASAEEIDQLVPREDDLPRPPERPGPSPRGTYRLTEEISLPVETLLDQRKKAQDQAPAPVAPPAADEARVDDDE